MARTDINSSRTVGAYMSSSYLTVQTPGYTDSNGVFHEAVMKNNFVTVPSNPYTVLREVRLGSSTPGYNSPKRTGFLRPLSYSYVIEKWSGQTRVYQEYRPAHAGDVPINTTDIYVNWSFLDFQSLAPLSSSVIDAASRRLTTSLRNELKNQSFNAAQAMAERKQTASTVSNAATRIAKAITAVGRRDLRGAADALGVRVSKRAIRRNRRIKDQSSSIANGWLELQYGWKPLLDDVYGATKALVDSQNNVQTGRVRKRTRLSATLSPVSSVAPPSGWAGIDQSGTVTTATSEIQMSVRYVQSSSQGHTLASLGITNPALLAWELLPYSFVVDWFLPIGNYLSSLDATVGLTFLDGYTTTFSTYSTTAYRTMFQSSLSYPSYTKSDVVSGSYFRSRTTRTVLQDFPAALTPRFKNPLSVSHAASAMALLRQSFKR